jgi:hypothetical protein
MDIETILTVLPGRFCGQGRARVRMHKERAEKGKKKARLRRAFFVFVRVVRVG